MRFLIEIAAILLFAFPAAFVLTVATFPLWRWIDLNTSLESFGHSGPAEWCFYFVYSILVVAGLAIWRFLRRGANSP